VEFGLNTLEACPIDGFPPGILFHSGPFLGVGINDNQDWPGSAAHESGHLKTVFYKDVKHFKAKRNTSTTHIFL
jgi:hypothetical protein